MRLDSPWADTLIVIVALEAAAAIIGYATGHLFLALWLATLCYLVWQMQYIFRLDRWLRRGGLAVPPEAPGIWGDVFNNLRRAQERYRRRRKALASLLAQSKESANAMPDAAVILGRRGELQWWNDAASRLLALRAPQDVGQRVGNLIRHPEFRALLRKGQNGEALTLPSPVRPEVTLEIRIVPYGDQQRLLLVRDVTRLQRLELMRREFVANVSHELRTPLTVIRGLAETLAETELAADPDNAKALTLLQQQTQRMGRLVEDLLLLSRLETTDARQGEGGGQVDIPRQLRILCDEARALSGGQHQLELEADEELALLGDEGELRSAFSNIIFNAVKYTPAGGSIRIRWARQSAGACLEVSDTGPGIAPTHLSRLTERFYRVDRGRSARTGGSGLGLAIVKHVLHRHEAKLLVESELGVGSTFRCVFPQARVVLQSSSVDSGAL
ncbi:MAG TPA: phosphate regulon sensor histidine kinase PhoR [Gammaproteobacteria bacterium]|nr:phosphate regulon sensor histidine kinase PhoR [Gammaproteobacteria bacterium]